MIEDIKNIVSIVTEVTGITKEQIMSKDRHVDLADARHIAIALCRNYSSIGVVNLGAIFNRDHSTIIHACTKTQGLINNDKIFTKKYFLAEAKIIELGYEKVVHKKFNYFKKRAA